MRYIQDDIEHIHYYNNNNHHRKEVNESGVQKVKVKRKFDLKQPA
jgi:hypothetical protein